MSNIIVNFPSCEITCTDLKPTTITDTTNSKGTSGQILSSTGSGIDWINPPASTWVGTATSNLDMNSIYDIVKARSLDNNGGGITIGASVNNANGITIGKSSGTGTTTIVGTLDAQTIDRSGTINIGTSSGTSIGISRAGQTTTVNGTLNSATIDRAGTIDIGATSATTITIGKTTATASTTNIRGKVLFDSQSGTVGQYLKSEGASIPPTWATLPASTFVPTATTNLNMDGFAINNCQNLNGNTSVLNIGNGAGTTATVIGKSGAATNIQGNVLFGGASGTSGQFLQSNGASTTPTWVNGSSAWSGTATSNLDMNSIYDIVKARSLDNNGGVVTIGANTTGMTIGKALTTTTVNGTLDSATIDRAGTINIGATSATDINIGRSAIPITVAGSFVSVDGVVFNNNAISSCSSLNNSASTAIAIGDTQTTGILNIGTNANRTADVNIMNGTSASGSVNIMGGTTAVGGVNISTGSTNTGTINILTGSLSAGELNLGGGNSSIRIFRPLTLNYLASQATASSSYLGGTVTPVYTGTNPNNSVVQLARVALTPGVWMLIGQAVFSTPGAGGFFSLSISAISTVIQNSCCQSQSTFANNPVSTNLSRIVATDANVTWYLTAQTPVSCPMTNVVFTAYRIA